MNKKGFTVVELLLYLGLLTIFTVILTRIFTAILDVQLESVATSAVEGDSRFIFSRLAYDINRADSIVTPNAPGVEADSLTLMMGTIANTYSINLNNLMLANDNGAHQLNGYGTQISNLSFMRLGNENGKNSIRITFTITSTVQEVSGPETKIVETTIGIR